MVGTNAGAHYAASGVNVGDLTAGLALVPLSSLVALAGGPPVVLAATQGAGVYRRTFP